MMLYAPLDLGAKQALAAFTVLSLSTLLTGLLKGLESRHQLETSQVDDVLMGCANGAGEQGSNIAKGAIIDAGWHKSVPDFQLDRFCTSDLKAVNTAAAKVASGMENLIVASGVESMSCVPIGSNGGPFYWTPNTLLTTSALLKA